jgi:hypothetical protein
MALARHPKRAAARRVRSERLFAATRNMEQYDLNFRQGWRPAWDGIPAGARRRVFGVDYARVRGMQGGEMFFTRYGWEMARALLPRQWFVDDRYRAAGRRLTGSTGTVYMVPHANSGGSKLDLVVKFSRMAQHAGHLEIWPGVAGWSREVEFLSPFAEFGNLCRLRDAPGLPRLPTKTPLAIYCPPLHFPLWNLGRQENRLWRYDYALAADQRASPYPPVNYEWERLYILLYRWIEGIDAEEAAEHGLLNAETMAELTRAVDRELAARGFVVLDHKPRHIIVRPGRAGGLRRDRHGDILRALVDYELLVDRELPG